jgi:four helix bundle protein
LRSTYEVMTAVEIARGLGYLLAPAAAELHQQADEIAAMLVGLMRSLSKRV